jgi:glycosyltransferase involved in cell wall biosynthesis
MKHQKRLCIVYWNMGLGGIQKRIRDIVIEISGKYPQWDIYLLLLTKTDNGLDKVIEHIPRLTIKYYLHAGSTKKPLGFALWIFWQYCSIKPEAVLTFQFLLSCLIVVCRQIVIWVSSKIVINEGAVSSRNLVVEGLEWGGIFMRAIYNRADRIIVPTLACKNDLVMHFNIQSRLITIIPNWTLYPPLKPQQCVYDLLFVGRFEPEKNPLGFITLVKTLTSTFPLLRSGIVGQGTLLQHMKEEILKNSLQKNISIIPYSYDVRSIYLHSRILVVPSYNEGMPNVVLEAAMCQVPSVINNFLGANEVIKHGKTGYIYHSNFEATETILWLLNHEKERKTMGQRAQQYVSKNYTFSIQKRFIDTLLS